MALVCSGARADRGRRRHRAAVFASVRLASVGFVIVALLLSPVTADVAAAAAGQTLNIAISQALNANCAALGAPLGTQLTAVCAAAAGAPSSDDGGTSAAQSDTGGSDNDTVKKRLQQLRGEETSQSPNSQEVTFGSGALSGFAQFDYQNVDKHTTSFETGFTSNKYGGTVGVDYSFGKAVVGAALDYGHTNGTFDAGGGNFNTDAYGTYIYGSYLPIDNLFIDAVAGYRHNDTSLNRVESFSVSGTTIASGTEHSNPVGNEFRVGISGGYDFSYNGFTFGPRVAFNYTHNQINAFGESGSTGLELAFDSQGFTSATSSAGVFLSKAFSTGFGVIVPQASADYIHEFADDQQLFTAHFVQDLKATPTVLSFESDGPDRDYFGLGFGVVMVLPHGLSPYLNYRALVGDSLKSTQTVTAGLRVEF